MDGMTGKARVLDSSSALRPMSSPLSIIHASLSQSPHTPSLDAPGQSRLDDLLSTHGEVGGGVYPLEYPDEGGGSH